MRESGTFQDGMAITCTAVIGTFIAIIRLLSRKLTKDALRGIVGNLMAIVLTKRQREVLQMMADGEELVQSRDHKGFPEYWVDLDRVHHKTWWALVENVLISTSDDFSARTVYWHINESGERFLAGETKI